jgi:hypothetical protein
MQFLAPLQISLASVALFMSGLAGHPAAAQNLLANPRFPLALGISHWPVGQGTANWAPFECGLTSPFSGSAYLDSALDESRARIWQCVLAEPGKRYDLSTSLWLGRGEASIAIVFHGGICGGEPELDFEEASAAVIEDWIDLELSAVAPPGTISAAVHLAVDHPNRNARAYFDDVVLRVPEPSTSGAFAALMTLAGLARSLQPLRAR